MPWRIDKREDKFCVIKETDGSTEKCHPTRKEPRLTMKACMPRRRRHGPRRPRS